MSYFAKSLAAGFVVASIAAAPVLAAGTHPVTGEALADDQTFTYRVLDEHTSHDPQLVESTTGSEIVRDLFEGLMNQDAEGNLVPGVATGYTTNDEKTVYTFTLRDNAKWSDGNPVTAHDFVYAWQRAADPELASPYAWFLEYMYIANVAEILTAEKSTSELGVSAIDDYTFEVRLSKALPYFAQMTTHATTFPTPSWVIEEFGAEWTKPKNIVSNGAYVLTEHVPHERNTRERNDMYWNNDATIVEKVVSLVINDENVAFTRFTAGELDRTEIPAGQYPRLSGEMPDKVLVAPRLCSYYYTINLTETGNPALQDVRVRQALSLAMDRNIITEKITAGGQIPAYTFTPGATAGFEVPETEASNMTQAERDARAVELMTEAGYGADNPVELSILYNTSEAHKKIAVAIGQMWKQKLGVVTELNNVEAKTLWPSLQSQDYDIGRAGWCGDYNEASTFLNLAGSDVTYNFGKYINAEVDSLLAEAATMSDPTANYTAVEEAIARDVPIFPIYHYTFNYLMDTDVGGWPIGNVEQNWYSKDLYKVAE